MPQPQKKSPSPLWLLVRVNSLHSWRRLLAIRKQSRLLTAIITSFIIGYLVLSFWIFYTGMKFIAKFPGLGSVLTERLLYVLFAFLFAMLLLSNLIIGYTNLFRNRETAYLLTLPVSTQTIFCWKFIESVVLSSWAFLFLISPLLAAFGLVRGVPWHFYPVTVFLIVIFTILPGVFGAGLAIVIGRFLDRKSFQITLIIAALTSLTLAAFWWKVQAVDNQMLDRRTLEALDQLLARTRFTLFPYLPSYWLSSAVLQWAEGITRGALFFAAVLLSYILFFGSIAFTRLGNLFYNTASAVQSRPGIRFSFDFFHRKLSRAAAIHPLERLFQIFFWLKPDTRALALKDLRMFWRDTTQWGQSVMFFGLLGVYVVNLRNFTQQLSSPFWINAIAFLNLGACAFSLASVTTRFVFPQFSLEGRRIWIVGMSPMGLVRVVKIKYWLAGVLSLAVTLGLIALSCYLLQMEMPRAVFFSAVVCVMALTLNGLAVGLGVLYPNLRETNPNKIVSGFGGTLCFVLSSVYIVAALALLIFAAGGLHDRTAWSIVAIAVFVLMSAVLGWFPMKLALQQLEKFEA